MEVWITGLGCLSAAGSSVEETWRNLLEGSGPEPTPPPRLLRLASALGLGEMNHPAFSLPDAAFSDGFRHSARDTLNLARTAALEALAQAGLNSEEIGRDGQGAIIIGSTAGNALHFLEDYAALKRLEAIGPHSGRYGGEAAETGSPSPYPGLVGTGFSDFFDCNPAEALADEWGSTGPALTVGNACCSGSDAIGLGLELIASGRCRRALAGGADALSLVPYIGFRRLMIYSDQSCRPFDKDRKGLNLGEGAGLMLLENSEDAAQRGARPLARLLAYGAASDAHHLTAPHPEAAGLRRAIKSALARSGLGGYGDLAFVNAHGTATPDNDRVEALAVKAELPGLPLWAVKGSTGHTLGAAGGLEAVLTVAALRAGLLPPSRGFSQVDPGLGLQPSIQTVAIQGRAAVSLSLGFGGGNSALIFERSE